MAPEIYGWYKRPPKKEYVPDPENTNLTDQAFMPISIQVKRMTEAGERLDEYRRELYDFGWDQEALARSTRVPATRAPEYALEDAQEDLLAAQQRLADAQIQAKTQAELNKAIQNEEESSDPSGEPVNETPEKPVD